MNQREYEALSSEQLPHEAKLLYVLVLRRHMDYRTGISGRVRWLSFPCMREALEVVRPRRSRLPPQKYTSRQVRYYLELLENHGLIQSLPEPCVYKLLLATSDLVRPDEQRNYSGTTAAEKRSAEKNEKPSNNAGLASPDGLNSPLVSEAKRAEQRHTSVYPNNNSLSSGEAEKKFPMFPSWDVFDQDRFAEQCALSDVCWDLMGLEQRERCRVEFVRYEMTEGRMATQEAWEHRFINTLVRQAEWGRVPSNGLAGRQNSYQ